MLGYINSWLSGHLAGIQADPSAVAYNKVVISPAVVGDLTQASGSYHTPHGLVSSAWTKSGSTVRLQVSIPFNTSATIKLPVNATNPVASKGPGFQGFQNGYAVYKVGSGYYLFTSQFAGYTLTLQESATSNNSLEYGPWSIANLIDGITTSTPNSEGYTSNTFPSADASSAPPYVDIDLGNNQKVSTVILYPRTDAVTTSGNTPNFPVAFTIQVAPDGGSYTTVDTITNQANPAGAAQTYTFPQTTARHVRLVATTLGMPAVGESVANAYRLQLAEMVVK
jgi:hypothetical protein